MTFSNLDVSSLLGKMEQLSTEVCSLKKSMQLQADVGEDFRAITVEIDRRLCALERPTDLTSGGGTGASAALDGGTVCVKAGTTGSDDAGLGATLAKDSDVDAGERDDAGPCDLDEEMAAGGSDCLVSRSPKWSQVVKKGRRLARVPGSAAAQSGSRTVAPGRKKRPGNVKPVVGTGAVGSIKTVKTKLVSVFATRFSPDLDAETLSAYLKEILSREVNCLKIDTVHRRFSSFKVSAECNEFDEMYIPELWPEGAFVRRYFEPRRAGVIGSNHALAVGGISLPAGAMGTHLLC